MPRLFPPLRPKRPANEAIPEPLRTPVSPSNFAPELVCSPSMFIKTEKEDLSPRLPITADIATQTVAQPSAPPSYTAAAVMADAEESQICESVEADVITNNPSEWPSEVYNQTSTMWLLPPNSNQSSAIATLLQGEIQSHNITREMLHATEQRRLEAVQKWNQFANDARGWAAAYKSLSAALGKCAEECSRVASENVTLRTQLQTFKDSRLENHTTEDDQIRILYGAQTRQSNPVDDMLSTAARDAQGEHGMVESPNCDPRYDTRCPNSPYSNQI